MLPMGRRRSTVNHGLEPRVYSKHGAYYYVHRDGRWERLGTVLDDANRKAQLYNDPTGQYGTLVYWLDLFLMHCAARVAAGTMASRTYDDYDNAVNGTRNRPGALRVFFAPPRTPLDVTPSSVKTFLDTNRELGRPVPANREKACLSACMSWLISNAKVPGLQINPCLRASGIRRNPERPRDRYVTDSEYRDVWAQAPMSVRLMMELTYRTLQRPESDIILWDTSMLMTEDGQRKLHFRQGKTGRTMKIAVPTELDALIRESIGPIPRLRQPIVRTRTGELYSYDGLSAMLKRAIARANALRTAAGAQAIQSFGFRDLKGKGATDMWRAGISIEQIQLLCGHADKSTTEIYVKQRWHETAMPNMVLMGA